MSLSSATNRTDATGNGSTSVYPYTFRILDDDDLLVTIRDTDNAQTTLTKTTDYTVSGVGAANGGNVTLVNNSQAWLTSGNLKNNYRITIRRVRSLTQTTDIRNQGSFLPETHEDAFDHFVMLAQQLDDALDRCIKLKETEAGTAAATEVGTNDSTARANKVLGYDAAGTTLTLLSNVPTSGVSASAFMQTVLDDADAATARTTLGFSGSGGTVAAANLNADVITGQTALTSPDTADVFLTYDASATALRKITFGNMVTGHAALTAPEGADEMLVYDTSATAVKKMTLSNLVNGMTEDTGPSAADFMLTYDASATTTKKVSLSRIPSLAVPAGTIIMFGGSSAPTGYLLCDGSAVSRTTYADLFAIIGGNFGTGDGSTTFNVPDMRSRHPIGMGQGSGLTNRVLATTGGAETHTLVTGEIPAHTHTIPSAGVATAGAGQGVTTDAGTGQSTGSAGGGGAHNNMGPFLTVNFCIKT